MSPFVNIPSSDKPSDVSMSSHNGSLVVRDSFIRLEIYNAYEAAVHEFNERTNASITRLRGEVAVWADQFNQKMDLNLHDAMLMVDQEVRASTNETELRLLGRSSQQTAAIQDHAYEINGELTSLHLT